MAFSIGRYHRFCRALKHDRLKAGLRQLDIAEALGRTQSFVAKVESGERQLDFIETLDYCSALGIAAEDLIQVVAKGVVARWECQHRSMKWRI